MSDNRSSPRYNRRLRAVLITEENGIRVSIQGKTQDISSDGTSFISERNFVSSHPVTVYLMIDPGNAKRQPVVFEAQCKIVSSVLAPQQGGFRLGLQFTKMPGENKQVLQKFLAPLMALARGIAQQA